MSVPTETKTDAPRTVAYNLTIRSLLEECRKFSDKGPVLRNAKGKPYAGNPKATTALEHRIRRTLTAAGIHKRRGCLFNLFRHTMGSRLVERGMSFAQTAHVLGNGEDVCRQHYIRFSPTASTDIMAVLDKPAFIDQTIDRPHTLPGGSAVN